MLGTRRIFVGSSSEALGVANCVKDAIDAQAGLGFSGVLWNSDAFPMGQTLVETIEKIPFDYDGAVLVWTPDQRATRDSHPEVSAPVPNVVFEYGYLAARLTRQRVAICRFQNADLPSDLMGVKFIEIKTYDKQDPKPLEGPTARELGDWLRGLPVLAPGLSPIGQVHGYSGIWSVQNQFTRWRGRDVDLEKNEQIYFDGKTSLTLSADGSAGSGTQFGHHYVFVEGYTAVHEIVNEVVRARVDSDGTLVLSLRAVQRMLVDEQGTPPDARFHTKLPNTEWQLLLKPNGEHKTLEGTHRYRLARADFQMAVETWQYDGMFNAPCL